MISFCEVILRFTSEEHIFFIFLKQFPGHIARDNYGK